MRIVLIAFALSAGLGLNLAGCAMPEEYTESADGNNRFGVQHRIPDGGD